MCLVTQPPLSHGSEVGKLWAQAKHLAFRSSGINQDTTCVSPTMT